jgi:hypothetical protein
MQWWILLSTTDGREVGRKSRQMHAETVAILQGRKRTRRADATALLLLMACAASVIADPGLAGRRMRSEAQSIISADLHLLADRESRRRGLSLPAIVAPGEEKLSGTFEEILLEEGSVQVIIGSESPSRLVPELQARGMTGIRVHENLRHLRGSIPIGNLFTLEDLRDRGALSVQAEYQPMRSSGSVVSQADWLMEADRVRASMGGYDGTGQRIGTLSDSYNRLGGAAAGMASGDLPVVDVLQDLNAPSTIDEGRAMVELMYDIAPGASYAFATAFISQSGFADNMRALAADTALGRCTIIVDDVYFPTEPFFQDGVVAQAIDEVVTQRGVAYFSAAGNLEDQGWETLDPQFVDVATALANGADFAFLGEFAGADEYEWLDFDPTGNVQPFHVVNFPALSFTSIAMQWDDPYYNPTAVRNDLDLFAVHAASGTLVKRSMDRNRNKVEVLERVVFDSVSATSYRFYVGRYISEGDPDASIDPPPSRIKWVNLGRNNGPGYTSATPPASAPTISPHSASSNAMSVGAVDYWAQHSYASFTSMGPSTILFGPAGTPLGSVDLRAKPDITALQGTNTTFFFAGNDIEGDGKPNFSGTSAAAPHAAAIAALVRQRFPDDSPAEIYERLRASADPGVHPANRVGAGLINAWKALYSEPEPARPPYSTGFESGFLGAEWETRRTGSQRAEVTGAHSPAAGGKHLALHASRPVIVGRSEATLHLDLSGMTDVELSFLHRRATGESPQAMPASFANASNSDGVAYSVDGGTTWKRVVSLTGINSTTTVQPFNFDLSSIASSNGDSLDGIVLIRFQEYDNQPAPTRGHFHDEVFITANEVGTGLPGDVNDDGFVNVADVTTLMRFLDGLVENLPSDGNADFNADGEVDDEDVSALVDAIVND